MDVTSWPATCKSAAPRLPRLLSDELVLARADGSYGKLMQTRAKTDLLILDDWGLAPLGDRERRDLLEISPPYPDRPTSSAHVVWQPLRSQKGCRRDANITADLPKENWTEMSRPACIGTVVARPSA